MAWYSRETSYGSTGNGIFSFFHGKRVNKFHQIYHSYATVDNYWKFYGNIWFLPKVLYNWLALVVWWNELILHFANALNNNVYVTGPLFIRWTVALPYDLGKSRGLEFECCNDGITLNFDRHLGSTAAVGPDKFQSNWNSLNLNLAASRLNDILW